MTVQQARSSVCTWFFSSLLSSSRSLIRRCNVSTSLLWPWSTSSSLLSYFSTLCLSTTSCSRVLSSSSLRDLSSESCQPHHLPSFSFSSAPRSFIFLFLLPPRPSLLFGDKEKVILDKHLACRRLRFASVLYKSPAQQLSS